MKVKGIPGSEAAGAGSARADCPQMGRVLGGKRSLPQVLWSRRAKSLIFEGSELQESLAQQLQ